VTDTAPASEALVAGMPSWTDVQQLVRRALRARAQSSLDGYHWVWIVDMTASHVVYEVADDELWQCGYTLTGTEVTLGEAERVARAYVTVPGGEDQGDGELAAAVESAQPGERDHLVGRVLEAKATTATGGRVFAVRIIAVGDSLNGNRYSEAVLAAAAPLYEGAKAYDRHRNAEDLKSGTIAGLVGHYRNVTASAEGLDADLYLLPSATHAAEVLDAALAAQADGLPPTAGISHDVLGTFRPLSENGRSLREATAITHVFSADVVSDPSAGGRATRVVAGGIHLDQITPAPSGPTHQQENAMPELSREALTDALADLVKNAAAAAAATATENTTTAPAATTPPVVTTARESFAGRALVRGMVAEAGLPEAVVESVVAGLPEHITEADVARHIEAVQNVVAGIERAGLAPELGGRAEVTKESRERKIEALDLFFTPDKPGGYTSFVEAYCDITGDRQVTRGGDMARRILRESFASPFDSAVHTSEALDTSSWPQILGDSITRRAVAEYARPNLQTWRLIVSSTPTVTDFREQRIDRLGGYGTLPIVGQSGVYQQLTSPTDEEATYSVQKRGGIEVITWEMIRNDDVRALSKIPTKLGLAAAQTLYRFVWDMLVTNAATSYDSVALFHATHANTDAASPLSQSTLSTARQKMGVQSAYGDSSDVLSIEPKYLVVPAALEEMAFMLTTSAVAIPSTPAGPSDAPNIHQGMTPIKVPYYSAQATWFVVADPSMCPTIEVGFLDGRQEPEFFTQSDPSQGSTFSADKHEIKIRHVYSGTVLDHRGMYRGVG
jgi:hypothetical protein